MRLAVDLYINFSNIKIIYRSSSHDLPSFLLPIVLNINKANYNKESSGIVTQCLRSSTKQTSLIFYFHQYCKDKPSFGSNSSHKNNLGEQAKLMELYQKPSRGAHVLVVSFALQGHLNPMLQFAKRLASSRSDLKVTVVVMSNGGVQSLASTASTFDLEIVHRLCDGFAQQDIFKVKATTSESMFELLDHYKQNSTNLCPTPKMVIYNAFMSWLFDVVKKCGFKAAPFFTQSCLVGSLYYHVKKGYITNPVTGSHVSLPCVKDLLTKEDLPSFVLSPGDSAHEAASFVFDQYSNLEEADCVFVNTVGELEDEVLNWMKTKCPVKTIGPTIPSMYLDKRLPDDKAYSMSLFQSETHIYMDWLNKKESGSVVYIAMGSLSTLAEGQMNEVATCLEKGNKNFLWVAKASEESKLPPNYKEKISEKGLIVNWTDQLEVLAHPAIGCFVTHCGWNSTVEAVSLGVPLVAFPQRSDQPTNAKCITDFWKSGLRVKVNNEGIATREEIESCIHEVMEGERAEQFKSNAAKLKQLAKAAMQEGGSSDCNIEELVMKLLSIAE